MLEEAVTVFFVLCHMYGNPNNHFHVRSLLFHKKMHQKTYFALLLSDANRSFLPSKSTDFQTASALSTIQSF